MRLDYCLLFVFSHRLQAEISANLVLTRLELLPNLTTGVQLD